MTEQVSPLRQRLIDDMMIRNMSPNTQKAYIRAVKNFSLHFGKSPDKGKSATIPPTIATFLSLA